MGLIKKSDLSLDYNWSSEPGTSPIDKDTIKFDRQRGDDVLDLINNYAEKSKTRDKTKILKAEPIIREKLPKDIETRDNALKWLWSAAGNDNETR